MQAKDMSCGAFWVEDVLVRKFRVVRRCGSTLPAYSVEKDPIVAQEICRIGDAGLTAAKRGCPPATATADAVVSARYVNCPGAGRAQK